MKKEKLLMLLDEVRVLGLEQCYIDAAREFLEYNEYALCFDTIAENMYEYDVRINKSVYQLTESLIQLMKLPKDQYLFIKELYNDEQ